MYEQVYSYPITASPVLNTDNDRYSTWQQETGLDEVSGSTASARAIPSFIETSEFNLLNPLQLGQYGINRNLSFSTLEPDFNQRGDLTLTVKSRANARAVPRILETKTIPADPTPEEQLTKLKSTGRFTSFRIASNQAGGYFEFGAPLIHSQPGDGRMET